MLDKNGRIIEQRRKGPDIWVRVIHWLSVCGWVLMTAVLILTDKAKPQMAFFLDRIIGIPIRTTWDQDLIRISCFLMIIILCLCTAGLIINSRRHQRKEDRYNRSLIVMGVLAVVGILICFFKFQ